MKLIELLVQETLNGKFKWPSNASQIFQDYDGELRPDAEMSGLYLEPVAENHRICGVPFDDLDESYIVTREQYEAALAAAQQPVWNGEGLPPVGCECEALYDSDKHAWFKAKIIAHDSGRIVARWLEGDKDGEILDYCSLNFFRPIRSEADKKRDEIIEEIAYHTSLDDARDLYEAIAAGHVKGVKLDV